jgi:type I restriction enzyme S subunit
MTAFPLVELGKLCRFISGGTPRRNVAKYFQGDVPWITGVDVTEDVITKARHYITQEAIESSATNVVPKGNILLVTRTGVGKVAIAGVDICISQDFTGLIPDKTKADVQFLYYYLQDHKEYFVANQRGATIQGVTREVVASLKVPFPPLPEQKHIAAILAKADRLRRLRRTARDLSDTYLQSVFLEMFGDPVTNPMGWEIKEVGTQIKSIRYGTGSPPEYQKDGIPFIRATNIKRGTVQRDDLAYISETDARSIAKCKVNTGDLIIVRSGVNTGDCALIPREFDGAYAAYDLIIQVPYPQNYYYNSIINSDYGKSIIRPLSRRAGQPHINADQVKSLRFPIPPTPLQEEFAHIVHKFEQLCAQQREAQRQAEHLFQTLLHRAFRGEL